MKQIFKKYYYCFLFGILLNSSIVVQGQTWEKQFPFFDAKDIVETNDGFFVMAGNTHEDDTGKTDVFLSKINQQGELLWTKEYDLENANATFTINTVSAMIVTKDGGFAIAGSTNGHVFLLKTNASGNLEWQKVFESADNFETWSLTETEDDGFVVAGYYDNVIGSRFFLLKTNDLGEKAWLKSHSNGQCVTHTAYRVLQTNDNGYFIVGNANKQMYCIKTDANGEFLWTYTDTTMQRIAYEACEASNGDLIISGYIQEEQKKPFIERITANGAQQIWLSSYYELIGEAFDVYEIFETREGGFAMLSNDFLNTNLENNEQINLTKINAEGVYQWNKKFGYGLISNVYGGLQTSTGDYILVGDALSFLSEDFYAFALRVNQSGENDNLIEGFVFLDNDEDCVKNAGDLALQNWIVQASSEMNTYFANTNEDGSYSLAVDSGIYQITIFPPNDLFAFNCGNQQDIIVNQESNIVLIDFPAHTAISCQHLQVDISTPVLEHCNDAVYFIDYCNTGTQIAENAYVEIELDSYFSFENATLEAENVSSNIYAFQLGNIDIGDCGSFKITTHLSCDALPEMTHCMTAHIYPDLPCILPNPDWTGSVIEVSGACMNENLIDFTIKNHTFDEPTSIVSVIEIYEDNVMRMAFDTIVNTDEDIHVEMPANGSTWRIEATQTEAYPTESYPRFHVEACGENSDETVTLGIVNTVFEDDLSNAISIDCQQSQIVTQASSNGINVSPTGVHEENYINATDELEYQIHFQNLSYDTSYYIIVTDTLSPHIDITSLQIGTASHPYSFNIRNERVLEWTFENIEMPSSAINLAESRGFVKYKVAQKANNEIGTLINNAATIYLNNEIMNTNTTSQIVGENYFEVKLLGTGITYNPNIKVAVAPNPSAEIAHISIEGLNNPDLYCRIYTIMGQKVYDKHISGQTTFSLPVLEWKKGIYIYEISNHQQLLATGKMLIK
ncbi:MAG: DUF7619 domain-containing protein [Chitinophagales bacterium]